MLKDIDTFVLIKTEFDYQDQSYEFPVFHKIDLLDFSWREQNEKNWQLSNCFLLKKLQDSFLMEELQPVFWSRARLIPRKSETLLDFLEVSIKKNLNSSILSGDKIIDLYPQKNLQ